MPSRSNLSLPSPFKAMNHTEAHRSQNQEFTRRQFVRLGAVCAEGWHGLPIKAEAVATAPELAQALAKLEPYFTPQEQFRDVSRGQPLPHSLSQEQKRKVGLTRETWRLEVLSDPDAPATLGHPMTQNHGTALDFAGLMKLAAKHSVRFAKTMSCLNIGRPLGTGIWEGVPLREVLWLTQPRENVRRVFYYGYHNDD